MSILKTKKILLFKPGTFGHRSVILGHIVSELGRRNIDFVTLREDLWHHPIHEDQNSRAAVATLVRCTTRNEIGNLKVRRLKGVV